jgi:hypothetical protein
VRWTKPALRARLAALSERHSGRELVDAVVAFADTLEEEDRELLRQVLLERAGHERLYDNAIEWPNDKRPFRLFRRRRRGRR